MDTPLQLIRVDEAAHRAWHGDQELTLPPLQFRILARLTQTPGKVVTLRQFMQEVWNAEWWGTSGPKSLHMHISQLRRKLGDDATRPRYIETVRGVGFRMPESVVDRPLALQPAPEPRRYRLPLRIDRHGQTIYDAADVLVAAAMTPAAARWLVEVANARVTTDA